jgi:ferredoxin--NADP+ reductase
VNPLSIGIVGAGPAGCYAAQALSKNFPDAEITILDRLPVPFGLLRYGVAADHQGTKAVQHQFERLFSSPNVEFVGGLEYGRHVDLDRLRSIFDVVVLATGAPGDRRLGVEGETLEGVIGAGRLTRALNSHPEACSALPVVLPRVAIVGSGNVAADLLRLLSKTSAEWDGSDMDDALLHRILPRPVTEIHLLSRSDAAEARWDAAMLRELGSLRRPRFQVVTGSIASRGSPVADALRELVAARSSPTNLTINLYFACVIEQVLGRDRVEGIRIRGQTGLRKDLPVETVLTAIGFEPRPVETVPARVYRTGWLRTGPQGAIPAQRTLSKQLALEIARDLRSGLILPGRPGRAALPAGRTTNFAGWRGIDEYERAQAAEQRVRRKISDIETLYSVGNACPSALP